MVLIGVRGGDSVVELAALVKWLRAERELAGQVRPVTSPPGPTDLGGWADTVSVVLGSGGVGVVLAQSLSAWLRTRRSDVKVTITVEGTTIEIDARQVSDPTELIIQALGQRDDAGT